MDPQHLLIRLDQCRMLSLMSPCVRARVGAMLLDPVRNVVLMDGYNAGPTNDYLKRGRPGEPSLCRGAWCERNGFLAKDVNIVSGTRQEYNQSARQAHRWDIGGSLSTERVISVKIGAHTLVECTDRQSAESWISKMVEKNPPIEPCVRMECGCHHAEMNVICAAAAKGISTEGTLLMITGEPCLMCAKHIHHAGITEVVFLAEAYGNSEGLRYLEGTSIRIERFTHAQINEMARELRKKTPGTNPH